MGSLKRIRLDTPPAGSKPAAGDAASAALAAFQKRTAETLDCTVRIADDFANLVRNGLPFDGAADYLCIPRPRARTWQRKGRQFLDGDGQPEEFAVYGYFVAMANKALAEFRKSITDDLMLEETPTWIKFMTILERRDRHNYSKAEPAGGSDEDYQPDERFI